MNNINLTDVTNGSVVNGKWVGTGVFDKLAEAVSANIQIQYDQGQIKGSDYANAYVASLQNVLQQSIEYVLREKLTSAQIDDIAKSIEVKERSMVVQESELADKLLTSARQRAVMDKDIEVKTEQKKEIYTDRIIKDKQAAALGLDSVVKMKEASRASGTYVYIPAYEETV